MNNFIDPTIGVNSSSPIQFFTSHQYVIEIEFSKLEAIIDCVEAQLCNPKFKVLKITNCENIGNIETICKTEAFRNALRDSSHWFFVIFEVIEVLAAELYSAIIGSFNYTKPVLFQVTDTVRSVIFEKSDLHFGSLNLNEICENVHYGKGFLNLISVYVARKGVSGQDLLHLDFDANEVHSSDDVRLIHHACQSKDILSLRFLMLYDWDLSRQNEDNRRVLEIDARPETFAALLDLPFDISSEFLMISEDRSNLLNLIDSDRKSILMRAAEWFSPDTLEYLIRCGANVHYKRKKIKNEVDQRFSYESASDIAYDCQRSDNLKILLEADGFFPDYYREETETDVEIKKIVAERIKFFNDMQEGRIEDVQSFLEENRRLKRVFSIDNEMALDVACKLQNSNRVELVTILTDHGCQLSDDLEQYSHLEEVQEELAKHFPTLKDGYIHHLLSRTRFASFSQTQAHKPTVEEIYKILDRIPMTQTLMRVVQHYPDLDIIFDFDERSIVSIKPSEDLGTFGSALYKIGRLYIGAKSSQQDVIGTLAHEMTHLAMQMLYNNSCKPYRIDQTDLELKFQNIVNEYHKKCVNGENYDNIVKSVYSYKERLWPAELIVRIPHMTAYQREISTRFSELSKFYNDHVQPDVNNFILNAKDYKRRMIIVRLNKTLGITDRIPNIELQDKSQNKLNVVNVQKLTTVHQVLVTTQTNLLICCLKQKLKTSCAVFATIHQITLFSEELVNVHNYRSAVLIIDCTGNENVTNEEFKKFYDKLSDNKKLILIQSSKCKTANDNFNAIFKSELTEVDELKWNDLSEASKKIVLSFSVLFQGIPLRLNQLFTSKDDLDVIDDFDLESFFTNDAVKIGESLPLSIGYDERYFIQRDFKTVKKPLEIFFSTENFDQNNLVLGKNVIINGPAGMGKSTALTNIALQLKTKKPTYWIEKVELKQISLEMTIDEDDDDLGEDVIDLLIEEILKKKQPKTLRYFLNCGRLILMFDGFDEMDEANRKRFVLLLKNIQDIIVNPIWVTTRSDCLEELSDLPEKMEITLRPFSRSDQIKFMVEYWQSITRCKNNVRMKQIAGELIQKFEECIKQKLNEFLGTPLQTRMLAEIFIPDENFSISYPKEFDAYRLYNQFISARLQILYKEKNFNGNYIDIWKAGWEAHERIAKKDSKVFDEFKLKILKDISTDSVQYITPKDYTKIGLLQLNADGEIEFIHRTFTEFFIAHFIANQLVNSECRAFVELKLNPVIVYFINSYLTQNDGIKANLPEIADKLIAKQKENRNHLKSILEYCERNQLDGATKVLELSIVSIKEKIKNWQFEIGDEDDTAIDTVWFSKVIAEAEKGISSE